MLSLSYRNHYDVKILWTSFWRSLISRCKLAFRRMCTATYWWRKYVTYCVMRMTGSHSNDFIVLSMLKVSVFRENDMVRHFRHQYVAVHIRRVTWYYVSSLVSFSSRHFVPRSESFAFRRWTSSNGIHDPSNQRSTLFRTMAVRFGAYNWFANEVLTTQINTRMQFWEVRRFNWYFYYNSSAPCATMASEPPPDWLRSCNRNLRVPNFDLHQIGKRTLSIKSPVRTAHVITSEERVDAYTLEKRNTYESPKFLKVVPTLPAMRDSPLILRMHASSTEAIHG